MSKDNTKLLEMYKDLLKQNLSLESKDLLRHTLNLVMKAERELHNKNYDDKSNGFYSRNLGTPYGKIQLDVPRTRSSEVPFRPAILPNKFIRNQEETDLLLEALLTCNYSPNQISAVLRKLGLSYSEQEIKNLSEQILLEFEAWNQRPLNENYVAIFIDAYNAETMMDNKVHNLVTFVVQAIDFEGKKDIVGIFFLEGKESKEFWLQIFNKLIHRGLKKPLFVITDDFAGVKQAVEILFPQSLHQLCLVHLKRNIRKNIANEQAREFIDNLNSIINSHITFEQAQSKLSDMINAFKDKYPAYANYLTQRISNYLQFMHLNKNIRKYFYSTNTIESFNSIIETMRRKSGNFFQNQNVIKINIFINYKKISQKWKNGIPLVKFYLYEINQLFVKHFNCLPYNHTQHLG